MFSALALLAANSCAMAGIYTIVSMVEGLDKCDPALGIWLACLCVCYIGLDFFLRRERSERSVIIFCAVLFLLQLVLALVIYGFFAPFLGILIAICMWLYSYYSCYELATKPLTAEKLTKSFDLCSLVLIFALFFCSVKQITLTMLLPMTVSTVLCLPALVLVRGGERRSVKSLFISSILVLAFAAAAMLFAALASGGVKKLTGFVMQTFFALFGFLLRVIETVFRFVAGLFPARQYETLAPLPTEALEFVPPPDMSFELVDPEKLLIAMLALGISIVILAVAWSMIKGKKLRASVNTGRAQGLNRSRSRLFRALKRTVSRMIERIGFLILSIRARNTAQGLFLQIERKSRSALHGRAESESCREFLKRAYSIYPHAEKEIAVLADAMDSLCFGQGPGLSSEEVSRLRRNIFKNEE